MGYTLLPGSDSWAVDDLPRQADNPNSKRLGREKGRVPLLGATNLGWMGRW